MNYYKYIVNPITKKKIDIKSVRGVQLLKSYIGGSGPALGQINTSERGFNQKIKTIEELKQEIKECGVQLNQKKETISGLNGEIKYLDEQLASLELENVDLHIKTKELTLSNQTLNQELELLRYQLENTISEHDDCLKKLKLSDKKTATLKTENSQLKLMNKEDSETIKYCHDDLEHLESENSLINKTNGDLEEQLNVLDFDNKKLLKENNKLQDELETCHSELESIEPYMAKALAAEAMQRVLDKDRLFKAAFIDSIKQLGQNPSYEVLSDILVKAVSKPNVTKLEQKKSKRTSKDKQKGCNIQ